MRTRRPYVRVDPDELERIRQIDLLTYLREFEPGNLQKVKGTTNVYCVNNGELVPSARSNCTTLPKQEYHLAGWLYRSATVLCQRCEPLFR